MACGVSAAVLLGLPTPGPIPPEPHLVVPVRPGRDGGRGARAGARIHPARLPSDDVVVTSPPGALRVTSIVRTVLDCSREWGPAWGLAVADAAVAKFGLPPEHLLRRAHDLGRVPGARAARCAAESVRDGVESPLESLNRATILLAGLPHPDVQVWITTDSGRFRVDLLDPEHGVISEADGRVKYTDPDALWREKLREDALRRQGHPVVRFTMADHHQPDRWIAHYRQVLADTAAARRR